MVGESLNEALYMACFNGQAREVRRLLSGGADANAACEGGGTALTVASQNGHVEIVDMLHAAQANFIAADDHGQAALCCGAASTSLWC